MNYIVKKIPFIMGAIIGMNVFFVTEVEIIWRMGGALLSLMIGYWMTAMLQWEYKKGEPHYKCSKCGYYVYCSSKKEHDKTCE